MRTFALLADCSMSCRVQQVQLTVDAYWYKGNVQASNGAVTATP